MRDRARSAVATVMDVLAAVPTAAALAGIGIMVGAIYIASAPFRLARRVWRAMDLWAHWRGDAAARERAESYARWRDDL